MKCLPKLGKLLIPWAFTLAVLCTAAQPQSLQSPQFMVKQCNEDAIRMSVDPRPFQRLVGSRFSLVLEQERAQVLILAQDCSQYWIDDEQLGPAQDIHVWLSVDGPTDTRPVVGAQQTRPTMTWLRVFDGSTNRRARTLRLAAGSVQHAIDGVVLDAPGPKRRGRVLLGKGLTYSWEVVSAAPPVRLVGVNHDVFTTEFDGGVVLDRIQALVHVAAAASPGTLQVAGSTDMLPSIPVGTYPVSVNTFVPMWARGTMGVSPPR